MKRITDVDLRLLYIFRTIVEHNGLVGAQLALNLSQSTVSTRLADLEKRLGFRLCHRGRAGFSLTKAGLKIYDASDALFSAATHFGDTAALISGALRGALKIGVADAMYSNPDWDFSAVLRSFHERTAAAIIELSIDSPAEMERLILEEERDVAIGPFFRKTVGLVYLPLFSERHALFCAKDHPLAHHRLDGIEELRNYAFVARRYLHSYDLQSLGHIQAAAVVEQMEAQALLIQSGCFIGYLPIHYAEQLSRKKRLCPIATAFESAFTSPFYLIYKVGAEENVVVRSFINRVKDTVTFRSAGGPG
ncbi:protein GbuR [Alphaproteobacteria bacterium]|nr:protein GbuR [Alphaproteobacteria bacterium]